MSLNSVISFQTKNGKLRIDGIYVPDNLDEVVNLMLEGVPANKIYFFGEDASNFNNQVSTTECFATEEEKNTAITWNIPKSDFDLRDFFYDKIAEFCHNKTDEYIDECIRKVEFELEYFKHSNSEDFIKCVIYIIEEFTKRGIFWGIGRGSSCASMCFFLIGLHKVDPIKYKIPASDFFKGVLSS